MIVLDTNVLSEAVRPSPSPNVLRWLAAQQPRSVFTTAITEAEIFYGIGLLPAGRRRSSLMAAAEAMFLEVFPGRVLPFDEEAARFFPGIAAGRDALGCPISQMDAMIAAIARSRRAAIATRNTRDFEQCGLRVINPWVEKP
jgi:predicted nucleic acid-binding protein